MIIYQIIALSAVLVIGLVVGYILALQQVKKKQGKRKMEFKKMIVIAVILTYFLGVGLGVYITITTDPTQLMALLTYIGTPTTGAILSYCWVVRTENAIKLKQQYPKQTEGISVDLNNTQI